MKIIINYRYIGMKTHINAQTLVHTHTHSIPNVAHLWCLPPKHYCNSHIKYVAASNLSTFSWGYLQKLFIAHKSIKSISSWDRVCATWRRQTDKAKLLHYSHTRILVANPDMSFAPMCVRRRKLGQSTCNQQITAHYTLSLRTRCNINNAN